MKIDYGFFEEHTAKFIDLPLIYHYEAIDDLFGGFSTHWHENIEILYFTQGKAELLINSVPYSVKAGDIFIINSNHIHKIICKEVTVIYHCVILDSNFCALHLLDYTNSVFSPYILAENTRRSIKNLVLEIRHQHDHFQAENLKALALIALRNIFRTNAVEEVSNKAIIEASKYAFVKATIKYIKNNFRQSISLDSISTELCVSKFYLSRLFKDVTGQTINNYLSSYRCEQARILIKNSDLPMKEIAYLSGFSDTAYFSKCYRKSFSISPSADRKQ